MPMYELSTPVLFAGLAGLVLGAFFFGSLWWTVRRTLSSAPSVLAHLGILVLRLAVTLFGFYALGAGHWERLLACLAGFVVARFAATWLTRTWERRQPEPAALAKTNPSPEVGRASQP
jgi:F1F0 ATPase subunit 2